jgi:hypothetical protein
MTKDSEPNGSKHSLNLVLYILWWSDVFEYLGVLLLLLVKGFRHGEKRATDVIMSYRLYLSHEGFEEKLKKKVKQSRYTPWRRLGERRYSSYSFSTSAPDGVSGQRHAPAALLPPGKGPLVSIGQEAGWAPEPVWTQRLEEKSSAPAGDRTPIARSSSP